MPKFRKKPVVVEAVQWFGREPNWGASPGWFLKARAHGVIDREGDSLIIHTMEGEMECKPGSWIIQGIKGELYPIDDEILRATCEPVDAAEESKIPVELRKALETQ